MKKIDLGRRRMVLGAGVVATAGLAGLTRSSASTWEPLLRAGEVMAAGLQRGILPDRPLVPEYRIEQLTKDFPSNGGFGAPGWDPDPHYDAMLADGFSSWRLAIDGLVARPGTFSLDQLMSMPRRTQITMHCCDEGWSAIAQWTGVPLRFLIEHVGMRDAARYVVFHCLDKFQGMQLYSSIDLFDAMHPQTILAWGMNGKMLPRQYGAPLRLRSELQIGYKNSKHIEKISLVESLAGIGKGKGGLWEDFGLQWYAGM